MKRRRVINVDFDSRPVILSTDIEDDWEEHVKENWRENKAKVREGLAYEFGPHEAETKERNLVGIGPKPFSVLAFHNKFLDQIRKAFIVGGYYPALVSACALGERILNHLVLALRDDFTATEAYKRVHGKDSFDNWDVPIEVLAGWGVLLPKAESSFRELRDVRNRALHFDPLVDRDDRDRALEAICLLQDIVLAQFPGVGEQPWFLRGVPGESYLKKEWEADPFVRHIYLPNSLPVGPYHRVVSVRPEFRISDDYDYPDKEISDDEFRELRVNRRQRWIR